MWVRWLTLPVLAYLALDFCNPMMPGAVQLVDGSLEVVAGCHARCEEAAPPAGLAASRRLPTVASEPQPILRVHRPVVSASSSAPPLAGPPLAPRSAPASSPDDD